ncbi:MAG: hypothetical protein AB3N15_10520 [Paracoccaceae bacterium]
MAYADPRARSGFFSQLLSTLEERKAARVKRARDKRKQQEIWRMSERELLDLGYSQSDLEAILRYHGHGK